MRPQLTFFCELEANALQQLFADENTIESLKALSASVGLGILDFSEQRGDIVRRLNRAAIPVVAWLLLPETDGYWFNAGNAPQAGRRYAAFKRWTSKHELHWAGIGLDFKPDIRDLKALTAKKWRWLLLLWKHVFRRNQILQAERIYQTLIEQIHADGYRVDGYVIPLVADERLSRSMFLRKLLALVDVSVDREVMLLYTSLIRSLGPGLLWSYAPEVRACGLGSTGGGVKIMDKSVQPLDWNEFARDLRHAWYWCHDIHVFSLEGCIRAGFLEQLKSFEWDQPIIAPDELIARSERWRAIFQSAFWFSAYLAPLSAALFSILLLVFLRRRRGARRG